MARAGRAALALALVALFAGLIALGVWQLQRLGWKRALIAQVEQRLAAAPVAAPGPAEWPGIGPQDAYRRVALRGTFRNDRETLVQAVTRFGAGFWVLTPLETDRGFTVLVNRGFVPPERRAPGARGAPAPSGTVTVRGLLRLTEPGGGFLRDNDPAAGRWYSRDVAAIARARQLGPTAPYFVDADAAASPGWPRGGLTIVRFPNNHLVYALTWFGMAALLAGALAWLARRGRLA